MNNNNRYVSEEVIEEIRELPFEYELYVPPPQLRCDCGEMYCSDECKIADLQRGHSLLCIPPSATSHPYLTLIDHCR